MQADRYLGALTRCNSKAFETCIKRVARQSGFGHDRDAKAGQPFADVSLYKFIADHSRRHPGYIPPHQNIPFELQEHRHEPRQSSI
jgi:hypothetical protein